MPSTAADVQRDLRAEASATDAAFLTRFFKAGPGEYGEGDEFLGVRVPVARRVVARHGDLPRIELQNLLASTAHEDRLAALLILVAQFRRASAPRTRDEASRTALHLFYLDAVRRGRVNNWDLVDSSADTLVGSYLLDHPSGLLADLAAGDLLWERRVAMIATFAAIRAGDADPAFATAELLLDDRRDLIQKAAGWMLREVGKRVSREELRGFLDHAAPRMGRTALSYATEHLEPDERARYRAMTRIRQEPMR